MSNLALLAQNQVTGFDANYLVFCLFGDTSSFLMFSAFSSAALLLHNHYGITEINITYVNLFKWKFFAHSQLGLKTGSQGYSWDPGFHRKWSGIWDLTSAWKWDVPKLDIECGIAI